FVAAREISVKKYVVKLTGDERRHLHELIRTGKHSAQLLMKARILLKADTSSAGDGWSDSQIVKGAGNQPRHGVPDAPTIGGRGLRSGADTQASGNLRQGTYGAGVAPGLARARRDIDRGGGALIA